MCGADIFAVWGPSDFEGAQFKAANRPTLTKALDSMAPGFWAPRASWSMRWKAAHHAQLKSLEELSANAASPGDVLVHAGNW